MTSQPPNVIQGYDLKSVRMSGVCSLRPSKSGPRFLLRALLQPSTERRLLVLLA